MSFAADLAELYRRDLARVARQIGEFPDEESVWRTVPGTLNPAGNLALHLEGNLREYVGRLLGGVAYTRDRPLEFAAKGFPRAELCARIEEVERLIPAIVEGLSSEQMEREFPQPPGEPMATGRFLMHLYGHLNWHLGQIDYARRMIVASSTKGFQG